MNIKVAFADALLACELGGMTQLETFGGIRHSGRGGPMQFLGSPSTSFARPSDR